MSNLYDFISEYLTEIEVQQSCYAGMIAALIENARYEKNITIAALSAKTGILEERIQKIENCECDITVSELINLCHTLDIPYNLTFKKEKNNEELKFKESL